MSAEEVAARVERLTAEVEELKDPHARRLAEELSLAVVEMHGEGLAALLAGLDPDVVKRAADDELVGGLLMLHGLHPVPIEERVLAGLAEVRPYMESHGGDVELLGVEDGVARLRLVGSCDGCAASASTLEATVEKALRAAAPDLIGMDVEGATDGIPLPVIQHVPHSLAEWVTLDGVADLAPGELRAAAVDGATLVVANCDGNVLAYRDACKSCGSSLVGGVLSEGVLDCPGCGRRWFLPRAGRSLDDDHMQLDPVPLLAGTGSEVRVAV